jgi:hypothetical protein
MVIGEEASGLELRIVKGPKETYLTKPKLAEKVYDLLHEYSSPNLPIIPSAIKRLPVDELRDYYTFLQNPSPKKGRMKRPECPVADANHQGGKSTYAYKQEMVRYIAKYGFRFEETSIPSLSPSLLETTANYLKAKTKS